jgi:nicotinate phosphoribosyltransferase
MCDIPGVKPANIVMKLSRCRINSKREWSKCIKISDDLGKHTGDPAEIQLCKDTLGIE